MQSTSSLIMGPCHTLAVVRTNIIFWSYTHAGKTWMPHFATKFSTKRRPSFVKVIGLHLSAATAHCSLTILACIVLTVVGNMNIDHESCPIPEALNLLTYDSRVVIASKIICG